MSAASQSHLNAVRACIDAQGNLAEGALAAAELAIETGEARWETALADALQRVERNARSVNDKCVCLLDERHPTLADLRQVLLLLKISHEMREVARLARDMMLHSTAIHRLRWAGQRPLNVGDRLRHVRSMLRQTMEALVVLDPELVAALQEASSATSSQHQSMSLELGQAARCHPASALHVAALLCLSIQVECALDHVGRIAEYVACIIRSDTRHPPCAEPSIPVAPDGMGDAEESTFLMESAAGAAPALADYPSG
jgi:phosphate transport system protein